MFVPSSVAGVIAMRHVIGVVQVIQYSNVDRVLMVAGFWSLL